jgi:hypothetical protein
VSLKPPKHQQHKVIAASSPMEKVKKKTPFLPATKKNFKKYKPKKIKAKKHLTASQLWKFAPNVKS